MVKYIEEKKLCANKQTNTKAYFKRVYICININNEFKAFVYKNVKLNLTFILAQSLAVLCFCFCRSFCTVFIC